MKLGVKTIDYPKLEDPHGRKFEHGVIVKLVSTDICGSDQHIYHGRFVWDAALSKRSGKHRIYFAGRRSGSPQDLQRRFAQEARHRSAQHAETRDAKQHRRGPGISGTAPKSWRARNSIRYLRLSEGKC